MLKCVSMWVFILLVDLFFQGAFLLVGFLFVGMFTIGGLAG